MTEVSLNSTEGKWIMASAILASSMAFIDGTALNVVLPALQDTFRSTGTDLFWILNAYLLMLASFILLGGSLGDKLGRKKIFMIGIAIFVVGSAACGLAADINYLIAFRMVQGIGGALMIPGSLSIISASFSEKERGKAIGTWSAITTVVTVGGPILGGALADAGLWPYIFFINLPLGIASIFILWFKVKESRDTETNPDLDYTGSVVIVAGLALLTFGFLRIPIASSKDLWVIASVATGVVLLAVFVVIEKQSKHPIVPLYLFSNKIFTGANLLTFFLYAGLGAAMLFLTLNFVQVQGYSQTQAGLTLLPFTLLLITMARFAGSLVDKYGPRLLLIAGPTVTGVGLLILASVGHTNGPLDYWTTFFPGIVVFGLGMAFTVAPLTATVMGALPAHFAGTASGINNAVSRIAFVFANAIFGAFAVLFFSAVLDKEIHNTSLSKKVKMEISAEAVKLGDAKVPASVAAEDRAMVEKAFKTSFISTYQKIIFICSGLAFMGAVMAIGFIKNEPKGKVKGAEG